MGEVFCNNKSRLVIVICAIFLLLPAAGGHASYRELDLFKKGYEYYLSYRPEKAVEEFNLFLKEFPKSSSKDAVMFWLGKSFVQLKYFEKAKKVFSDIEQESPESPFIKYAKRELDAINSRSLAGIMPAGSEEQGGVKKEQTVSTVSTPVTGKKVASTEGKHPEKALVKVGISRAEKGPSVEPEIVSKTSSVNSAVKAPAGSKEQSAVKKEQTANAVFPAAGANTALTENNHPEKPSAKVGPSGTEKEPPTKAEIVKKIPAEAHAVDGPAEGEKTEKNQKSKKEHDDREAYAINSAYVLKRLGVKDVPWRSDNVLENMENEEVLYGEALRLNITVDPVKHKKLVEKYGFNQGQADYLLEYLTICELIDRRLKDLPGEEVVESLATVYKEGDKYRKIIASADLQTLAKNGMSFEEIYERYPDLVKFSVVGLKALDEEIRDKIRLLHNGQIAVIWSAEGYRILKPVSRKLSFRPFEEAGPVTEKRVKVFVGDFLNELREKVE
jgi:hypothetical protein